MQDGDAKGSRDTSLSPHALLVEDDAENLAALEELVRNAGFTTRCATTLSEAREQIVRELPELALVDLVLPDGEGLELLEGLEPAAPVELVLITGQASIESALNALRHRVSDYLLKPVDVDRLRQILERVADQHTQRHQRKRFREAHGKEDRFGDLIGSSPAMERVFRLCSRVAPSDANVMIVGETGTGKEMVAQLIHRLSPRSDGPFVALNCGGVTGSLLESELFGHERGSFTGANRAHKGIFERAIGGTLFLDEVTELPGEHQSALLRVLETRTFRRVGGEREIETDARLIAASNRSLTEAVSKEVFREDLLYRLHVFPIDLPPLREREHDVVLLAEHFLEGHNKKIGTEKRFTSDGLALLKRHAWPGNVRQLKNLVYRGFLMSDQEIGTEILTPLLDESLQSNTKPISYDEDSVSIEVGSSIAHAERQLIESTLEHCDGDKKDAAEILGISLKTLYNRLKEYREEDGEREEDEEADEADA